jgi:hypothetical protein
MRIKERDLPARAELGCRRLIVLRLEQFYLPCICWHFEATSRRNLASDAGDL